MSYPALSHILAMNPLFAARWNGSALVDDAGNFSFTDAGTPTDNAGQLMAGGPLRYVTLDGSSELFRTTTNIGISGGDARTLMIGVKGTYVSGQPTLMEHGTASIGNWGAWQVQSATETRYHLNGAFADFLVQPLDGNANIVTFTSEANNINTARMYLNGGDAILPDTAGSPLFNTDNTIVTIGGRNVGTNFLAADVFFAAVWDRALSADEVANLYHRLKNGVPTKTSVGVGIGL